MRFRRVPREAKIHKLAVDIIGLEAQIVVLRRERDNYVRELAYKAPNTEEFRRLSEALHRTAHLRDESPEGPNRRRYSDEHNDARRKWDALVEQSKKLDLNESHIIEHLDVQIIKIQKKIDQLNRKYHQLDDQQNQEGFNESIQQTT